MSAVVSVSWDAPAARSKSHARIQRAHLRSVSTGDTGSAAGAVRGGVRASGLGGAGRRVSRRVRLGALAAGVLSVAGVGVVIASAQAQAPAHFVTVQAGQTLSEVAHEAYPQLPVANAVTRVQVANAMNSTQVQAGQRLQLPR